MEKVKIQDVTYNIKSIKQYNNLLEIEFAELQDLTAIDLSLIELFTQGDVKCATLENYTTEYKKYDKVVILSNDGTVYTEPEQVDPTPIEPEEPYVPTEEELALQLENNKKAKITESKTKLDTFLENNPYLFTDGKYYSVTREKQNLLNNAISVYQMKLQMGETNVEIKWNATGEECVVKTIEEVISLALGIANYIEPLVAKQQAFEVQINSFTTQAELDNLVIAYETII